MEISNIVVGNPNEVLSTPKTECNCNTEYCSDPILEQLSDEPLTDKPMSEKQAREYLKNIQKYVRSQKFVRDCNLRALRTGEAPKKIAKNYLQKVAGCIGDTFGIVVDVLNITVTGLIELISFVLTKAIDFIFMLVRKLINLLSFGYTNRKPVVATSC